MHAVSVSLTANAARDGADVRHLMRIQGWELAVMAGHDGPELWVRDLDLGERLGYSRPHKVRELIARLLADRKLSDSEVFTTAGQTSERGGRPGTEYWLSEAAALKVIAKSETAIADAILDEVIRVYMLARRGLLPSQTGIPAELMALVTQLAEGQRQIVETQRAQGEVLASLTQRLSALESGGGVIGRAQRSAISHAVTAIARSRVHAGLSPSMASARRWAYTRLETAAQWSGAGRSWDKLPASRFGLVLVELEVMQREVSAAIEAIAKRQLSLAIADKEHLEKH